MVFFAKGLVSSKWPLVICDVTLFLVLFVCDFLFLLDYCYFRLVIRKMQSLNAISRCNSFQTLSSFFYYWINEYVGQRHVSLFNQNLWCPKQNCLTLSFLFFSFFAMKLPWSSNMDGHWCQLRSATSGELISIDRRIPCWFHFILWLISITWLSSRLALHLLSLQVSHVYKTQSSQESICCIDHPFCSSCHHQWSSSHGTVLSLQICWLCKSSHVITCLFLSCFRCTLHVYWFSITERVSQCMLSRLARNFEYLLRYMLLFCRSRETTKRRSWKYSSCRNIFMPD